MDKRMLGDLIISYNNKRKALNNVERNKKKEGKLYPYYGANGVVDYINEYMIEDEVLCIASGGIGISIFNKSLLVRLGIVTALFNCSKL